MTTNLHYLIAGMAVLLVVLWQYSHQRQMDDRNSLMFRRLLTVVSLDVLAELVSTCFILYAPYSFGVGRMLSNTVFYLFQALLPLMLLYYVCTLCSSRVISTGTVLRMGIPTIALVFIILTNPFTEKLFYFDSTGYCHGPWYLLLYISAVLHIRVPGQQEYRTEEQKPRREAQAPERPSGDDAPGIIVQAAPPPDCARGPRDIFRPAVSCCRPRASA